MKIEWLIPAVLLVSVCIGCNDDNHTTQATDTTNKTMGSVDASPGKILFEQKCVACHGSNGTAGIGNAANLQTSRLDNGTLTNVIKSGRNNMPAFGGQLTPEQTRELVNYILSLRK